jgi:hypothetical protein
MFYIPLGGFGLLQLFSFSPSTLFVIYCLLFSCLKLLVLFVIARLRRMSSSTSDTATAVWPNPYATEVTGFIGISMRICLSLASRCYKYHYLLCLCCVSR